VPGTGLVSILLGQTAYLVTLRDGRAMAAPAWQDFVPSPDARFFVSPSHDRSGLRFFGAAAVLRAASRGIGMAVRPQLIDPVMRDEYPSIAHLRPRAARPAGEEVYRIVTGWFDGAAYRDYVVGTDGSFTPLHPPKRLCNGRRVSLPLVSPDGRFLGVRDEILGATVIYRMHHDGSCTEAVRLGLATGKIAFDPNGDRIAFAIPPGLTSVDDGVAQLSLRGVFLFDLRAQTLSRVSGSESIDRLTFPEFIGHDTLAFLVTHRETEVAILRLVSLR
jgi:hypothetical protein